MSQLVPRVGANYARTGVDVQHLGLLVSFWTFITCGVMRFEPGWDGRHLCPGAQRHDACFLGRDPKG